jgi:hypothetical protein
VSIRPQASSTPVLKAETQPRCLIIAEAGYYSHSFFVLVPINFLLGVHEIDLGGAACSCWAPLHMGTDPVPSAATPFIQSTHDARQLNKVDTYRNTGYSQTWLPHGSTTMQLSTATPPLI